MRDFDAYEYVGVIAPGAVVAVGLFLQWPHAKEAVLSKDFSLGSFGVFLISAFVLGHLVQGVGNVLEAVFFWPVGGLPTNRVLTEKQHLLSPTQRSRLAEKVSQMQGVPIDLNHTDKSAWYAITREIYAAVAHSGGASRVDAFNRTYGLLRGIAAALILLVIWFVATHHQNLEYVYATGALAVLALFRMARFARAYARELFIQYLAVREAPAGTT
ncbi:MAG TPA: hypothetical protein VN909_05960 [Candidatus Dormibacteraeota bacterium]|nr:hypothetical protein [Candidatus Dormibacteraeota bacterium]